MPEHLDRLRIEAPLVIRQVNVNGRITSLWKVLCDLLLGSPEDLRSDSLAQFLDTGLLFVRLGFDGTAVALPEVVQRAKQAWLQERKTSLREERSFADYLAQGLYSGRDYAWLAQYDQKIARLTAQEVTFALRKYLAEAPIVWRIGRGN